MKKLAPRTPDGWSLTVQRIGALLTYCALLVALAAILILSTWLVYEVAR